MSKNYGETVAEGDNRWKEIRRIVIGCSTPHDQYKGSRTLGDQRVYTVLQDGGIQRYACSTSPFLKEVHEKQLFLPTMIFYRHKSYISCWE